MLKQRKTVMRTQRKSVAIVDDDSSILRATEDLLDARGFEVQVFVSAEEFLESGAAAQVDCLLLDLHLRGMSGIDLRRQLVASRSNLPVIIMTAFDYEAVYGQVLKACCVAWLRKPLMASQLFDAIEKAVFQDERPQ
jgi:FixJ family two-component response regulator